MSDATDAINRNQKETRESLNKLCIRVAWLEVAVGKLKIAIEERKDLYHEPLNTEE